MRIRRHATIAPGEPVGRRVDATSRYVGSRATISVGCDGVSRGRPEGLGVSVRSLAADRVRVFEFVNGFSTDGDCVRPAARGCVAGGGLSLSLMWLSY